MPTGNDVISIEMGLDSQGNWAGGVMNGGVIYGDAYSVQTSTGTDLFYFGSDTISVGTLTGDGKIYGDAYEPTVSGTSYGGLDSFYVGMMSGGAIYGDYHTISNGSISDGNDDFTISGMSGGTIYGDAHTLNVNHIDGCSDVITIDSDSTMGGMSGGTIYGDAYEMKMNAVGNDGYVNTVGNDIFLGSMTGGAIYGNAHTLDLKGLQELHGSFGDRITVRSTLSNATIFGDADTLSVGVGGNTDQFSGLGISFGDEIVVDASVVNKATIYGDARVIDSLSFDITSKNSVQSFMSDKIEVGDVLNPAMVTNNTTIYGDAETIKSVTFNTTGTPVIGFGGFMSDTITINGSVTDSIIYGDARVIEFMNWGDTDNGSMPFAPTDHVWYGDIANSAPLSDNITVTGTLGAGAIIYGDTESGTIENFSYKHQGFAGSIDSIGHDNITVGILDGGKIHAGFGNDIVTVNYLKNGSVNMGTGEDTFKLNGFEDGATLHLDFGDDDASDLLYIRDTVVTSGTSATIYLYNFNTQDSIDTTGWTGSIEYNGTFTLTKGGAAITFIVEDSSLPII